MFTQSSMEHPFVLSHTFDLNGVVDAYEISFDTDKITIRNKSGIVATHRYGQIHKIKYSSKTLTLKLDKLKTIKIPITKREMDGIDSIVTPSKNIKRESDPIGAALVHFGPDTFYVSIYSYSLSELKSTIIHRISRYFYPAIECGGVKVESFDEFDFYVVHEGTHSELRNPADLEAACVFSDNKIIVEVRMDGA